MRWIAIFIDTPEMLKVRAQHERAHIEYLDSHQQGIVLAGGCRLVARLAASSAGGDASHSRQFVIGKNRH